MLNLSINRTTMGFQCGAPASNQDAIPDMILVGTIGKGRVPWAKGNYAARWAELFMQM